MSEFFLTVLNMSISASWAFLAVFVLRLLLKKAPKWLSVLLWVIVAVRLVCPVSFESVVSLVPSTETVSPEIMTDKLPTVNTGFPLLNNAVNPSLSTSLAPDAGASVNPLQVWIPILSVVWAIGVWCMLLYALVSSARLKMRIGTAVLLRDNIFQSENVSSPFVFGIIKPKIYLPFAICEDDVSYVISHERAHVHRRDYLWKPIGFLILSLHWFNPLMWVAYVLLCRDIELACDEKAVCGFDAEQKANYSEALLNCSISHRAITACPIAFGETDVKNRVRSVLNYKKPAFWVIIAAVLLSIITAVCFLTDPASARLKNIEGLTLADAVENTDVVWVSDGERYSIIGDVDDELLSELFDIKISKNEISESRDKYRDRSHTLVLQTKEDINLLLSYLQGLYIHFDADFKSVWVAQKSYGVTLSYKVKSPDDAMEIYEKIKHYNFTESDVGGVDDPPVVIGKRLTLDDVKELSQKGDALSWEDFENYSYVVTGSGLYIRCYEIDEMFSLYIGSGGLPEAGKPLYIYLRASDEYADRIDIREGNVERFINQHKNNPVVKNVGYSFRCCPVDNSDNFQKMFEMGGITASGTGVLPTVKITGTKQLADFVNKMDPFMNFELSYDDTPSFNEISREFTDEYFENNTLLLVYASGNTSSDRFSLEYARKSLGVLSLGVMKDVYSAGDTVKQGWLVCMNVENKNIKDVYGIEAYVSSFHYPDSGTSTATAIKQYTFKESEEKLLKPNFTLLDNGKFTFTFSGISSYLGVGEYDLENGRLTLKTDDGRFVYCFNEVDGKMVFDAEASSEMVWFSGMYDGCVFE